MGVTGAGWRCRAAVVRVPRIVGDLDRQVARLTVWATEQNLTVAQVVCEVWSELNGKRPKLRRVLSDRMRR